MQSAARSTADIHTGSFKFFPMPRTTAGVAARPLLLSLTLTLASCSSCEVPRDPVIPADITGTWHGAYTLYDGTGRRLTDSLLIDIESDRGEVVGSGLRKRYLPGAQPMESEIRLEGSVVLSTFRLELVDPVSQNRAVFSGKIEGDTLSGQLSVDGEVMGDLRLVGYGNSH